jgi:hypothetical protein
VARFPFRGSGRRREKEGDVTRDIAKEFAENYRGREIMSFDNATIRVRWTNKGPVDKEIRVCEEIRPPSTMKRLLARSAAMNDITGQGLTLRHGKLKLSRGNFANAEGDVYTHRCDVSKIRGSFCYCHRQ